MSSASKSALARRRKHWRKKNKKLRKRHIAYVRIVFRDPHDWAIHRVVQCTHHKCGTIATVDSKQEGRQLARRHERTMAVKKAKKKAKKGAKV